MFLSADPRSRHLVLITRASVPATWWPGSHVAPVREPNGLPTSPLPATLTLAEHYPPAVRLYAGQADDSDASHFTIAYEAGDGSGTIEGWLGDDDLVHLQVRDGPLKRGE